MHILSILAFFICLPSRSVPVTKATGLASASKRKPTVFSRGRSQLYNDFFKIPKFSGRFRCVTSFALASPSGLFWHLWVTRPFNVRAWTHVFMLRLSNPCTEPKDSQPIKTQRHKTKSLGHYITRSTTNMFYHICNIENLSELLLS